MAILSNLLVRIGVDENGVRRGVDRAQRDFDRFGNDTGRRLDEQMSRVGSESGRHFSENFTRDSRGRLHDELGRFASEGTGAGQSLGMNMAEGLKGSSPAMAIAIGALVSLLPVIGAVASLGLVSAFGAAFTVIGLKAAATNKGVQKQMDGLKKHVTKVMGQISKPFVATWGTILKTARTTFDKLAPELGKAFKVIAPAVSRFVQQLGKGFEKLAPSIKPLGDAFAKLLDAIGPSLPGMFDAIAKSITDIANLVAQNPDMFAGFITGIIKIVPWVFKFIDLLAKVYVWVGHLLGTTNPLVIAFGLLVPVVLLVVAVFKQVKSAFEKAAPTFQHIGSVIGTVWNQIYGKVSTALHLIWGVISSVFNLIKVVITQALNIIKALFTGDFNQLKATVRHAMFAIQAAWMQLWTRVKALASAAWNFIKGVVSRGAAAVKAAISHGISAAKSAFTSGWNSIKHAASSGASRVVSTVRSLPGRIRSALGNLGHLLFNAGRNVIQGLLAGIESMIGTIGSAMGKVAGKIRGFLPFSPAKEGPLSGAGNPERSGAKIAQMVASGMTGGTGMVASAAAGLASAAGINPSGVAAPAGVRAAGAGGGFPPIVIKGDGSPMAAALLELLRMAIRDSTGGDVQKALGRS